MENFPVSSGIRRRGSAVPSMMAAFAIAGILPVSSHSRGSSVLVAEPPETDEQREKRRAKEALDAQERINAARARRDKRETRRKADKERTMRQQGRL